MRDGESKDGERKDSEPLIGCNKTYSIAGTDGPGREASNFNTRYLAQLKSVQRPIWEQTSWQVVARFDPIAMGYDGP